LVEKWRRRTPPRYAALPLHAVTNGIAPANVEIGGAALLALSR
jgi:hypothetical protein